MTRFRHLSQEKDVRFGGNSVDVRGWPVRVSGDNSEVGKVNDLLVDDSHRTRYVDIGLEDGRHVLMPSGDVRVDTKKRALELPLSSRSKLNDLPEYDQRPESVTPEYAASLTRAYDDAYDDRYHHDRADYNARWSGQGRESAGGTMAEVDRLDDIEVADGNADPRGWKVVGRDGKSIGEVEHLIGDTAAMKVRYLTVKLDKGIAKDRHEILVPTGHVDLDSDNERVIANALDAGSARDFPRYEGRALGRADEQKVTRHYSDRYAGERHFEHPRYRSEQLDTEVARVSRSEEELKVGTRDRVAGSVDVHRNVETEHVSKPVTVHREEVEVERRPVNASARDRDREIGEKDIRIPVREEEVVVEKRPRVKEEIVVKKRDVEETRTVDADVRKERVDIERNDDTRGRRK